MSDEALGGRLAERITELRGEGLSWRHIAQKLHADHGLVVTDETLRNWGRQLAEPQQPKAKAS